MTETYEKRQQRFENTIERNLIQEPDYKTEAVRAASTIPCENLAQFMNNVEYILKWLKEKNR